MGLFLVFDDLSPLAPDLAEDKAEILISDVEGKVLIAAPCLAEVAELPPWVVSAVQSLVRQAVLRWHRAGEGGLSAETVASGPFSRTQSYDTRGEGRLWPSEVRELQHLCRILNGGGSRRKAFTILPRRLRP